MQAVLALLAGSVVGGVVTGFLLGLAWVATRLGPLEDLAVAALVLAALLLDGLRRVAWAPPPPAIRTQVPQAWARELPLPTAATLYGLRLGAGPLTILNSWTWWAASVAAASRGVWASLAMGAAFALTRTVATEVVSRAVAADAPRSMASLRRREDGAFITMSAVLLVATALVAFTT